MRIEGFYSYSLAKEITEKYGIKHHWLRHYGVRRFLELSEPERLKLVASWKESRHGGIRLGSGRKKSVYFPESNLERMMELSEKIRRYQRILF